MIKTFDDILNINIQNEIETVLTGHWFPWYFNESANTDLLLEKNKDQYTVEYPQFSHIFMNDQQSNSGFVDLSLYILNEFCQSQSIEIEDIFRIKTNLILKNVNYPNDCYSTPHIDIDRSNYFTLIYYVSDSDGPTYVFNETNHSEKYSIKSKIDPKKGTFLYFDGAYYHAGSPPKEHDFRLLINYNFSIKPKL